MFVMVSSIISIEICIVLLNFVENKCTNSICVFFTSYYACDSKFLCRFWYFALHENIKLRRQKWLLLLLFLLFLYESSCSFNIRRAKYDESCHWANFLIALNSNWYSRELRRNISWRFWKFSIYKINFLPHVLTDISQTVSGC